MDPSALASQYQIPRAPSATPTASSGNSLSDPAALAAKYGIPKAPSTNTVSRPWSAGATTTTSPDQKSAETYGASFPAKTGEGPVAAGLKAAGNLPSSAINLGKGVVQAVEHPLDTLGGVGNAILGGVREGIKGTTGVDINPSDAGQKASDVFNSLSSSLKERYGSLENLQRTATNDPVGFATDILSVVGGGSAILGKEAELGKTIETIAKPVTSAGGKIGDITGGVASGVAKTTTKQVTGLDMPTIQRVIANPEKFTPDAMHEVTRSALGAEVKAPLETRISDLSATGKEYNALREAKSPVAIDSKKISTILGDHGISLDGDGKLVTSAESVPLSPGDKTAIEGFLSQYGPSQVTNSNSFLNARKALDNLSSWDATKTDASDRISRALRTAYDEAGKQQIGGLKELDTKYAPEVKSLNQLKKDFLNPDGTLKDVAINKIANATGKGKDQLLGRLEQLSPGISEKIKHLKAVEDIQNTMEHHKVGAYAKGAGLGYMASGGNPIGIIAGIMLSDPSNAVAILRSLGVAKEKIMALTKMIPKP